MSKHRIQMKLNREQGMNQSWISTIIVESKSKKKTKASYLQYKVHQGLRHPSFKYRLNSNQEIKDMKLIHRISRASNSLNQNHIK